MMFLPEMNRGVSVKKKRKKWFKGENVCVDGREGVREKMERGGKERKRGRVCWREWATLVMVGCDRQEQRPRVDSSINGRRNHEQFGWC